MTARSKSANRPASARRPASPAKRTTLFSSPPIDGLAEASHPHCAAQPSPAGNYFMNPSTCLRQTLLGSSPMQPLDVGGRSAIPLARIVPGVEWRQIAVPFAGARDDDRSRVSFTNPRADSGQESWFATRSLPRS